MSALNIIRFRDVCACVWSLHCVWGQRHAFLFAAAAVAAAVVVVVIALQHALQATTWVVKLKSSYTSILSGGTFKVLSKSRGCRGSHIKEEEHNINKALEHPTCTPHHPAPHRSVVLGH